MSSSASRSSGRRAPSGANGHGLSVPSSQMAFTAAAGSRSSTALVVCSHAVTATGLPIQANRYLRINAGFGNHKRSECGWVVTRACLRTFQTSPRACIGEPTIVCAAFTISLQNVRQSA